MQVVQIVQSQTNTSLKYLFKHNWNNVWTMRTINNIYIISSYQFLTYFMQTIHNLSKKIIIHASCYIITINNLLKNYYALDIVMQLHSLRLKCIKYLAHRFMYETHHLHQWVNNIRSPSICINSFHSTIDKCNTSTIVHMQLDACHNP